MRQKIRGMTLIEMLVVIGVIGILLATLTPSVSRYAKGVSLNGEAKVLTSTLREAQEKTITEQKRYLIRLRPESAPPSYDLVALTESGEELQKTFTLRSGETMTVEETIASNEVIFSPDGGPSASGNITISNGTDSKIVNVSPAGFISIQ